MHLEALSNLTYSDVCGPPNSPVRKCNIGGLVLTAVWLKWPMFSTGGA